MNNSKNSSNIKTATIDFINFFVAEKFRECVRVKKMLFLLCIFMFSCSEKKDSGLYPVIDVVNNLGKYQRVYCSDLFSSIELIPTETHEKCLIGNNPRPVINDMVILMSGQESSHLYAFNRSGEYINLIAKKGQGPGEYYNLGNVFFNTDRQTIYILDIEKCLEYDLEGNHIRSFKISESNINTFDVISRIEYVGDSLFVGSTRYNGTNKFKYCIFDQNGDIIKTFPNYILFDRPNSGSSMSVKDFALDPIKVDNRIYLKDYINDTIYALSDLNIQPAYIFDFGSYSLSKAYLNDSFMEERFQNVINFMSLLGFPNYFFYKMYVTESFAQPKSEYPQPQAIYGLYDIAENKNILLDTDQYLQSGIINDINGGLPFIPLCYAGNNEVVGLWLPDMMKEKLTDEYFASQTIKDQQGHQKLKEILKNMNEDDNPVIVIAKLK